MTTFRSVSSCGERHLISSRVSRIEIVVLQFFSLTLMGAIVFFHVLRAVLVRLSAATRYDAAFSVLWAEAQACWTAVEHEAHLAQDDSKRKVAGGGYLSGLRR